MGSGLFVNLSGCSCDNLNDLGNYTLAKWIGDGIELFIINTECTDSAALGNPLRVSSMIELDNIRLACIHAFSTPRCMARNIFTLH